MTLNIINNISIKLKLALLATITSTISIIITCVVFIVFDSLEAKKYMVEDISLYSKILGEDNATAIIYNQRDLVEQALSTLKEKESVILGCIYDLDGSLFSRYVRANNDDFCPLSNPAINTGYLFDKNYMYLYNNIITNNKIRGGIYIKSELKQIKIKMKRSFINASAISLIVGIISYFIAMLLQKVISAPILQLSEIAYKVTEGDYDVRAQLKSNDEVGYLTNAFNTMLDEIRESRSNLEKKVELRTSKLKQALQAKSIFLSNISHEIRTPIHGIINYSDFLVKDWYNINEDTRFNFAQKLHNNSSRLLNLINDLLDLSKLDAGKMDFNMQYNNVVKIAQDIIQESEMLYKGIKDLNIIYNYSAKVINAYCDYDKISQVLSNLLSNAIKFTKSGDIVINLEIISVIKFNKKIKILQCCIKDEGIGIPHEELESIFEKFSQSSRTKSGAGGTGLGLAICKEIISAHSGKIWAENNIEGKGASFYFSFPLRAKSINPQTSF